MKYWYCPSYHRRNLKKNVVHISLKEKCGGVHDTFMWKGISFDAVYVFHLLPSGFLFRFDKMGVCVDKSKTSLAHILPQKDFFLWNGGKGKKPPHFDSIFARLYSFERKIWWLKLFVTAHLWDVFKRFCSPSTPQYVSFKRIHAHKTLF